MADYLIRVDRDGEAAAQTLNRLPLGSSGPSRGINEKELQSLLFNYPHSLPVTAIDPTYDGIVPICTELKTQSGKLDAIYVNPKGRIVLVEFKLWRNPKARREVIGQMLDYAKDLASLTYEELQTSISVKSDKAENVLFKKVQEKHPELNENEFVDNVSRNLKRGEFMLLIVGDGIQEGVENIVDFVQRHSGLYFNLALVEATLYEDVNNQLIIFPRVLARTEIVQRIVIEGQLGAVVPTDKEEIDDAVKSESISKQKQKNKQFWDSVIKDFTFLNPSIETRSAFWPDPATDATLYVQVNNSSFNGWALFFGAFINRRQRLMGCYLAVRKGQPLETRIFESILASLDEHREVIGEDLEHWYNPSDRPRIGFSKPGSLSFLSGDGDSDEYRDSVDWMRTHLNRLVSHLYPIIQSKLADQ